MDTQFGFFDSLRFDDKKTFRHFDFGRTREEEQAANQKGIELLGNSPYKEHYATARLFLQALKNRSKQIPELISPHLGDRVPTNWTIALGALSEQSKEKPAANIIAALLLGGRIKVDPWNDQLRMLKSPPVGTVAESEKMAFQITPFVFYLTRDNSSVEGKGAVAAKLPSDTKP